MGLKAAPQELNFPALYVEQPAEQLLYAHAIATGSRMGFVALVVLFGWMIAGLSSPLIPFQELPQLWTLPLHSYRELTGAPAGWAWLEMWRFGDVLPLVGILVLIGCPLPCLLMLWAEYLRQRDRVYVLLCVCEITVMLFAASGISIADR